MAASSAQHPLDRPLRNDASAKVSLSAFAFLFSEMVSRAGTIPCPPSSVDVWESRLSEMGKDVGRRALPLAAIKEAHFKQRPTTTTAILTTICTVLWERWFGTRVGFDREAGTDRFYIIDDEPLVTKYIRMPPDYLSSDQTPTINFANYVAGMIEGALESCSFGAKVTAVHITGGAASGHPDQTMYSVVFDTAVMERERRLAN